MSNVKNKVGGSNYTNDFTTTLLEPLDCENRKGYITVLNVSYPLTTKNILEDECWFYLQITYNMFRKDSDVTTGPLTSFRLNKFIIPSGIYLLEDLIKYMNSCLNPFDVDIGLTEFGKVVLYFNLERSYCFKQTQTTWNNKSANRFHIENDGSDGSVSIILSTKLAYILGCDTSFKNTIYKKIIFVNNTTNEFTKTYYNIVAYLNTNPNFTGDDKISGRRNINTSEIVLPKLPDISDGLNNILIYCDQVVKTNVGDSKSSLLVNVPIQMKGQGSGETFRYIPVFIRRKLIKGILRDFHITLYNSRGELFNFDSGVVSLECRIDYD